MNNQNLTNNTQTFISNPKLIVPSAPGRSPWKRSPEGNVNMPGGSPCLTKPLDTFRATGESEVFGRRGLKVLSREEDRTQLGTVLTAMEMVHKDSGLDRFG